MTDRYALQFGDFVGPWRPAFAWLPIQLFDGHWVWLRSLEKRRAQTHDYLTPSGSWWVYRLSGDPI